MTDQPQHPASPDETPTTPAAPVPPEHAYAAAPAPTPPPTVAHPGTAPTAQTPAPPPSGSHVGLIIGAVVGGIVLLCLAFGAGGLVGWAVGTHRGAEISSVWQQTSREQARDHVAPGQKLAPGQRQNGSGPLRNERREGPEGRNGMTTPSPTPTPTPTL